MDALSVFRCCHQGRQIHTYALDVQQIADDGEHVTSCCQLPGPSQNMPTQQFLPF
jgi:hypothetical protein